uniref:Uncharacterized protein n=1 Tax=uncultured marine virus TaxID=186617 RepID=A0A0F7L9D4_9VIRU|nr:hypothetical protein [uncultured marine virus]
MTIKKFVESAIEGGWSNYDNVEQIICNTVIVSRNEIESEIDLNETLLDPKAWEAVGKVEGWDDETISFKVPKKTYTRVGRKGVIEVTRKAHTVTRKRNQRWKDLEVWKNKMNGLSPALIEGKDIVDYIETL